MSFGILFRAVLLLAVTLHQTAWALYDKSDAVIELTPANFESRVTDSDDIWIVEFFAPWCGHCKSLVPEYKKAATALKGIVKVGSVDADAHRELGGRFGVKGFPTIKIFAKNKKSPIDYSGPRNAQGLIDAAFKELRNVVNSRIGGGSSGGGSSGSKSGGSGFESKDVVEVTDSNFDKVVLGTDDLVIVAFHAPWCGHCKNLAPAWAQAASELKGKVVIAALDATVHTASANKYEVRGFPTIKVFPAGKKDGSAEDYNGGRGASDIVNFALEKMTASLPPPEVTQLTTEGQLETACKDAQLCVISVLPHILDCQSACRTDFLESLKKVGEKFKKNRWAYLWAEAGAQPELEEALEIGGFGYPAMAVVNARKMKYSLLRGSYSLEGITEFLRDLTFGRGSSVAIRAGKLPAVVKSEPWDGKDGKPPVVEDIDLSDVELDPLEKTEL